MRYYDNDHSPWGCVNRARCIPLVCGPGGTSQLHIYGEYLTIQNGDWLYTSESDQSIHVCFKPFTDDPDYIPLNQCYYPIKPLLLRMKWVLNHQCRTRVNYAILYLLKGWGPGAVVQAACLESRRSWVSTPLWLQVSATNKMFLPRSLVKIQYCGEPPWPQTAKVYISNLVYEWQCVISFILPSSGGSPGPV